MQREHEALDVGELEAGRLSGGGGAVLLSGWRRQRHPILRGDTRMGLEVSDSRATNIAERGGGGHRGDKRGMGDVGRG